MKNEELLIELYKVVKDDKGIDYILDEDILKILGDTEYNKFSVWMGGQTKFMNATYYTDVKNYFYNKEKGTLDNLPHGF